MVGKHLILNVIPVIRFCEHMRHLKLVFTHPVKLQDFIAVFQEARRRFELKSATTNYIYIQIYKRQLTSQKKQSMFSQIKVSDVSTFSSHLEVG